MSDLYFRMNESIIKCPVMQELQVKSVGDTNSFTRQFLFIRILSICADKNISIMSSKSLSIMTGVSQKQTDVVWAACLKHDVLRSANGCGYSAYEWMFDNGYVGKYKQERGKSALYNVV